MSSKTTKVLLNDAFNVSMAIKYEREPFMRYMPAYTKVDVSREKPKKSNSSPPKASRWNASHTTTMVPGILSLP